MKINDPQVPAEVGAAFVRYERALKEQDVATLDELFWASPLTLRARSASGSNPSSRA